MKSSGSSAWYPPENVPGIDEKSVNFGGRIVRKAVMFMFACIRLSSKRHSGHTSPRPKPITVVLYRGRNLPSRGDALDSAEGVLTTFFKNFCPSSKRVCLGRGFMFILVEKDGPGRVLLIDRVWSDIPGNSEFTEPWINSHPSYHSPLPPKVG